MRQSIGFDTALGWLELEWSDTGIRFLRLFGERPAELSRPLSMPEWVEKAQERITRFLAGEASYVNTEGIPLDLSHTAPFQRKVLELLVGTVPGRTITYGQLALMAGSPGGARAVGNAVARNPLPILIPCHRVLAADGLGGFSLFGSLESKRKLLLLEGCEL